MIQVKRCARPRVRWRRRSARWTCGRSRAGRDGTHQSARNTEPPRGPDQDGRASLIVPGDGAAKPSIMRRMSTRPNSTLTASDTRPMLAAACEQRVQTPPPASTAHPPPEPTRSGSAGGADPTIRAVPPHRPPACRDARRRSAPPVGPRGSSSTVRDGRRRGHQARTFPGAHRDAPPPTSTSSSGSPCEASGARRRRT